MLIYNHLKNGGAENMNKFFKISENWTFDIIFRADFRFIGLIENEGFGRYIGIKF